MEKRKKERNKENLLEKLPYMEEIVLYTVMVTMQSLQDHTNNVLWFNLVQHSNLYATLGLPSDTSVKTLFQSLFWYVEILVI